MKRRIRLIAAAALSLATVVPAWAHGIWFAQRSGRLAVVYGEGAEDVDVHRRLDRLRLVGAIDAAGSPVAVRLQPSDPMVFVDSDKPVAIVTATMDNGFWSRAPSGKWVAKAKDEVPGASAGGRYLKYATHLHVLPEAELKPQAGLAFQIVPVGAAFPRRKDERLTVQVLYGGKPVAGARVWQDMVTDPDGAAVTTDADGRASITVRNRGLNVVKAEYSTSFDDPAKADLTEHVATLSFMLAQTPE